MEVPPADSWSAEDLESMEVYDKKGHATVYRSADGKTIVLDGGNRGTYLSHFNTMEQTWRYRWTDLCADVVKVQNTSVCLESDARNIEWLVACGQFKRVEFHPKTMVLPRMQMPYGMSKVHKNYLKDFARRFARTTVLVFPALDYDC